MTPEQFVISRILKGMMDKPLSGNIFEDWQKRECLKCGYREDRKISYD